MVVKSNQQPPLRSEQYLERSLPNSEDSERTLLGAVFLDNTLITQPLEVLTPEDFYSPFNKRVFGAMITLFEQGRPIDPILVLEEMKKEGSVEGVGGISTIAQLTHGVPYFSDLLEYVKVIKNASDARKLIKGCTQIISEALQAEHSIETLLEKAEAMVYGVRSHEEQSASVRVSHGLTQELEDLKLISQQGLTVLGTPTHFTDIDVKLRGFRASQYIVVAGRPSIGKTSFMTRVMYNITVNTDTPTLFFSVEMARKEIYQRIIAAETGIDSQRIAGGELSEHEWDEASRVRDRLTESNGFFINDMTRLTTRNIRSEVRRVNSILTKEGKCLGLVVVDHIGLMRNSDTVAGRSREGEVSEISKTLKEIAREFDLSVVALSQLNRGSENRSDHRPLISDLRESGSLEQDADVVLLLYREDAYQTDPTLHTKVAEVIIGKNRNGPTGVVKLHFDRRATRFSNLLEGVQNDFPRQEVQGDDNLIF